MQPSNMPPAAGSLGQQAPPPFADGRLSVVVPDNAEHHDSIVPLSTTRQVDLLRHEPSAADWRSVSTTLPTDYVANSLLWVPSSAAGLGSLYQALDHICASAPATCTRVAAVGSALAPSGVSQAVSRNISKTRHLVTFSSEGAYSAYAFNVRPKGSGPYGSQDSNASASRNASETWLTDGAGVGHSASGPASRHLPGGCTCLQDSAKSSSAMTQLLGQTPRGRRAQAEGFAWMLPSLATGALGLGFFLAGVVWERAAPGVLGMLLFSSLQACWWLMTAHGNKSRLLRASQLLTVLLGLASLLPRDTPSLLWWSWHHIITFTFPWAAQLQAALVLVVVAASLQVAIAPTLVRLEVAIAQCSPTSRMSSSGHHSCATATPHLCCSGFCGTNGGAAGGHAKQCAAAAAAAAAAGMLRLRAHLQRLYLALAVLVLLGTAAVGMCAAMMIAPTPAADASDPLAFGWESLLVLASSAPVVSVARVVLLAVVVTLPAALTSPCRGCQGSAPVATAHTHHALQAAPPCRLIRAAALLLPPVSLSGVRRCCFCQRLLDLNLTKIITSVGLGVVCGWQWGVYMLQLAQVASLVWGVAALLQRNLQRVLEDFAAPPKLPVALVAPEEGTCGAATMAAVTSHLNRQLNRDNDLALACALKVIQKQHNNTNNNNNLNNNKNHSGCASVSSGGCSVDSSPTATTATLGHQGGLLSPRGQRRSVSGTTSPHRALGGAISTSAASSPMRHNGHTAWERQPLLSAHGGTGCSGTGKATPRCAWLRAWLVSLARDVRALSGVFVQVQMSLSALVVLLWLALMTPPLVVLGEAMEDAFEVGMEDVGAAMLGVVLCLMAVAALVAAQAATRCALRGELRRRWHAGGDDRVFLEAMLLLLAVPLAVAAMSALGWAYDVVNLVMLAAAEALRCLALLAVTLLEVPLLFS